MKSIKAIAFTEKGMETGRRLHLSDVARGFGEDKADLKSWTQNAFSQAGALVFIGAAGIAVRAVAPLLRGKDVDPAILVIDEAGRFVIPLLSGHIGGANTLAQDLAKRINAVCVLTTATDGRGIFAFDTWAAEKGMAIADVSRIKQVSAKMLRGEHIRLKCQWPIQGSLPKGVLLSPSDADVLISLSGSVFSGLHLIPKAVCVGVGCRKGASREVIRQAVFQALEKADVHRLSINAVHSIDLKKDEPGLLAFCRSEDWPFQTFSGDRLQAVQGTFSASDFVRRVTGVDNVCERAAVVLGGHLLLEKQSGNGVAVALGMKEPCIHFGGQA